MQDKTMTATFPPIEDIIAHRGNMLLIDRLVDFDAESCRAEYTPKAGAWYADADGNMPAWIGVELMAQTVAAYVGMQKRNANQPPKQGVLLGSRSYKTEASVYAAGEALRMEARAVFRDDRGLGAFECQISRADKKEVLATAMLKVYEPDDFDAFMKGTQE
jgi:predicted hotdog family 3-hydroxylacyl-ACP dehydratase